MGIITEVVNHYLLKSAIHSGDQARIDAEAQRQINRIEAEMRRDRQLDSVIASAKQAFNEILD